MLAPADARRPPAGRTPGRDCSASDAWTARTRGVLAGAAGDPAAGSSPLGAGQPRIHRQLRQRRSHGHPDPAQVPDRQRRDRRGSRSPAAPPRSGCSDLLDRPGPTRSPATRRCSCWSPSTAATTGSAPSSRPATRPTRTRAPDLAYAPDEVLPLADGLGLNPAMKGFKRLLGRPAAGRSCAASCYPKPDHSHFRSMAIWQTASPDHPVHDRLARPLARRGRRRPAARRRGRRDAAAAAGRRQRGRRGPAADRHSAAEAADRRRRRAGPAPASGEPAALRVASLPDLLRADAVRSVVEQPAGSRLDDPTRGPTATAPAARPAGGQSALGAQLDVVAPCIKAGAPTRAYAVSLGRLRHPRRREGHPDPAARRARRGALTGFVGRRSHRRRKVVVAVYSEFGRRVARQRQRGHRPRHRRAGVRRSATAGRAAGSTATSRA